MRDALCFSDAVMGVTSVETRTSLVAFAEGLSRAEGMLRSYHDSVGAPVTVQCSDVVDSIATNARIVLTMTPTKAILFSRSVIESINGGNLLVALHSLRGYLELVAVTRFTVERMRPLIVKAATTRQLSAEDATTLASHFKILLHGGRFNWTAYFEEGPRGTLERKRLKGARQGRQKFEANSLRIDCCIDDWAKKHEAV